MSKLLCWLFWLFMAVISWDFLTKEIGVINQAPTVFAIAIGLALAPIWGACYWILEKLYRGKINSLEGQVDLLEKRLESSKAEVENLLTEDKVAKGKPPFYIDIVRGLDAADLQVLEEIERFQKANPPGPNELPVGCDRESLMARLGLNWGELEVITNNLERLKLIEPMYVPPNAYSAMPIKLYDDRPFFLTALGQKFLTIHRSS